MHIDSKWKFKEMIQFRDEYAKKYGWNLIVESNMEAFHAGVGPYTHGSKVHTDLMKTQALLHALDKYKFDAAFGGARRDEEKSRAKERIFSFRDKFHHSLTDCKCTSNRNQDIPRNVFCIFTGRKQVRPRHNNGGDRHKKEHIQFDIRKHLFCHRQFTDRSTDNHQHQ